MVKTQGKTSFLAQLIDIRQTKKYAAFMERCGWQIIALKHGYQMFLKKIPFTPLRVAKILRAKATLSQSEILEIRKKYRLIYLVIQPFLINHITKNRSFFTIPTATIWLDLRKNLQQLKKELSQKTRYNLKLGLNNNALNVRIINGNKINDADLNSFYYLWSNNKPYNWLFKPSYAELKNLIASFGKDCFFVLIWHEKCLVSGLLVLLSPNMAFYWHNCSSVIGRKLFAPTLATWTAIGVSKKRGKTIFDFEGIWDYRYPIINRGWQGFSRFKKSFGGEEVYFPHFHAGQSRR